MEAKIKKALELYGAVTGLLLPLITILIIWAYDKCFWLKILLSDMVIFVFICFLYKIGFMSSVDDTKKQND